MKFRQALVPLAVFALVSGAGATLAAEMEKRASFPIAQGQTLVSIESAIDGALLAKGWTVGEKTPGRTLASITVRERHSASIAVTYDTSAYVIHLLSSEGLKQNDKRGTIHGTYVRWLHNLNAAIDARLRPSQPVPQSVYAPAPAEAPVTTPAPVPAPAPQPPVATPPPG